MGKATIRRVLGLYSACPRHVYAEGLRKGCRRVADQTPKASRSIPKRCGRCRRLRIGPRRHPEGLRMTRKGCRRVAEGLRSTPKPSRIKPLKLLKIRCRRYSISSRSRRLREGMRKGFPIIPKASYDVVPSCDKKDVTDVTSPA